MPKLESKANSQQDLSSGDVFILRDKSDGLITILMAIRVSSFDLHLIDLNDGIKFMPQNFNYNNAENVIKEIVEYSDKEISTINYMPGEEVKLTIEKLKE